MASSDVRSLCGVLMLGLAGCAAAPEPVIADALMTGVVMRSGKAVTISVGFSRQVQVGANEVVISAMQDSVMVDALLLTVSAEMPSMGHGSSGSVKPTRGDDGRYRGTVVFSMAGDWVLKLAVMADDMALGSFEFAIPL